jgi:hypothetical protein
VKRLWPVLTVFLLVGFILSCKSGSSPFETKKQHTREAIDSLEASCRKARAEGHGARSMFLGQQLNAKVEVDSLNYEDQPIYRRRLNEAWEDCAYYNGYQTVRKTLEPNGHPLTDEEIHRLSHHETIEVEAAYGFLKETKDRKELGNEYPYPDD